MKIYRIMREFSDAEPVPGTVSGCRHLKFSSVSQGGVCELSFLDASWLRFRLLSSQYQLHFAVFISWGSLSSFAGNSGGSGTVWTKGS